MAGLFSKMMQAFKFEDEDDEEEFERYEEKELEKEREKEERQIHKARNDARDTSANDYRPEGYTTGTSTRPAPGTPQPAHTQSNYGTRTYIENRNNSKSLRIDRPQGSKVFPIASTHKGNELCIMRPVTFEDSQDICDVLLSDRIAIINLTEIDIALAQRIMDFVSGSVYSINGKLYPITGVIFIATPDEVDISSDYSELIEQSGFNVPVFK